MNWSESIAGAAEYHYGVADRLMGLVDDGQLGWKPASGSNWMTTGQLLMHLSTACGGPAKGFVTGDWGMPEGFDPSQMKPEDMLPPAEKLPTIGSVAEARQALAADKQLLHDMLAQCTDEQLATQVTPAPWDPTPMPLGMRLMSMVDHLNSHKHQLFYYLKLQGKPVSTHDLWGM